MAANPSSELNELAIELDELMQAESQISARRRKLHERLASFPNDAALRQERAISDERQTIHRRIDELRARLEHEPAEALELSGLVEAGAKHAEGRGAESPMPEDDLGLLRSLAALTEALTELEARVAQLETGANRVRRPDRFG